jgi:hypothetical protein
MIELDLATTAAVGCIRERRQPTQVGLSLFTDFENFSVFKPAPQQEKSVNAIAGPGHRLGRRVESAAEETNIRRRTVDYGQR